MEDSKNFTALSGPEARLIFEQAVVQQSRMMIWTEGQKISFNTNLLKFHEAAQTFLISASAEVGGQEFERTLRTYGIVECLFSLYSPTDILYFRAEIRRSDHLYLNFKIKSPVYKLQRRLSLRLPVTPEKASPVKIFTSFDDQDPIRAELLNLSEGGIAVAFGEDRFFQRLSGGMKLTQVTFELSGISVSGPAEVRHLTKLPTAPQKNRYRMGIQFVHMDQKLKNQLIRFVLEESTKFFGRI